MNLKKGQSAIEFLILVMTMLFLFVILFYFIEGKVSDLKRDALNNALKEVAITVQEEINLAEGSTNGYIRQFVLPQDINGFDYIINITENYIYIRTTNGKNALALPVSRIQGNVQKGINSISKINNSVRLNI